MSALESKGLLNKKQWRGGLLETSPDHKNIDLYQVKSAKDKVIKGFGHQRKTKRINIDQYINEMN